MTRLHMIFARAANGVIGKDNAMPWHLPEDMAHFRRLTQGCPVIMGRKTWDSLPVKFRPLPGRTNIVITRQADWNEAGATPAASLDDAIALSAGAPVAWIMGGAQIYAEAEPLADRIEVTAIDKDFDGDAHAPVLGPDWKAIAREAHVSVNGLPFSFITYEKTGA